MAQVCGWLRSMRRRVFARGGRLAVTWDHQRLAFSMFCGVRKIPWDVALRGVHFTSNNRWAAHGYHKSTGEPVYDTGISPYVAIVRLVRVAREQAKEGETSCQESQVS